MVQPITSSIQVVVSVVTVAAVAVAFCLDVSAWIVVPSATIAATVAYAAAIWGKKRSV